MCGRFVLAKGIKVIVKKFNLEIDPQLELFQSYNVAPSQSSPVWSSDDKKRIQSLSFGYIPSWSKTRRMIINARSEGSGKYYNIENNADYKGAFHIKDSREFGKMFRGQRCLIFANCFYEGPKDQGLSKPYVVYHQRTKIFAFGGIWKEWVDKKTGEVKKSYLILTTYPNDLMINHIGHHRIPVIIDESNYQIWLDENTELSRITELLQPIPANYLNAYPVSTMVKNYRNNDRSLIEPEGQRIYQEEEYEITEELYQTGFGDSPARRRRREEDDKADNT